MRKGLGLVHSAAVLSQRDRSQKTAAADGRQAQPLGAGSSALSAEGREPSRGRGGNGGGGWSSEQKRVASQCAAFASGQLCELPTATPPEAPPGPGWLGIAHH